MFFRHNKVLSIPIAETTRPEPPSATPSPTRRESEVRIGINLETEAIRLSLIDPNGYESWVVLNKELALKMASYIRVLAGEKE